MLIVSRTCHFVHVFFIMKWIFLKMRLPYNLARLQVHGRMFFWQIPLPHMRTVLGLEFHISTKEDTLNWQYKPLHIHKIITACGLIVKCLSFLSISQKKKLATGKHPPFWNVLESHTEIKLAHLFRKTQHLAQVHFCLLDWICKD